MLGGIELKLVRQSTKLQQYIKWGPLIFSRGGAIVPLHLNKALFSVAVTSVSSSPLF